MLSGCCEALARISEHTARILIWTVKTQFGDREKEKKKFIHLT
jgi:hypothetical protein